MNSHSFTEIKVSSYDCKINKAYFIVGNDAEFFCSDMENRLYLKICSLKNESIMLSPKYEKSKIRYFIKRNASVIYEYNIEDILNKSKDKPLFIQLIDKHIHHLFNQISNHHNFSNLSIQNISCKNNFLIRANRIVKSSKELFWVQLKKHSYIFNNHIRLTKLKYPFPISTFINLESSEKEYVNVLSSFDLIKDDIFQDTFKQSMFYLEKSLVFKLLIKKISSVSDVHHVHKFDSKSTFKSEKSNLESRFILQSKLGFMNKFYGLTNNLKYPEFEFNGSFQIKSFINVSIFNKVFLKNLIHILFISSVIFLMFSFVIKYFSYEFMAVFFTKDFPIITIFVIKFLITVLIFQLLYSYYIHYITRLSVQKSLELYKQLVIKRVFISYKTNVPFSLYDRLLYIFKNFSIFLINLSWIFLVFLFLPSIPLVFGFFIILLLLFIFKDRYFINDNNHKNYVFFVFMVFVTLFSLGSELLTSFKISYLFYSYILAKSLVSIKSIGFKPINIYRYIIKKFISDHSNNFYEFSTIKSIKFKQVSFVSHNIGEPSIHHLNFEISKCQSLIIQSNSDIYNPLIEDIILNKLSAAGIRQLNFEPYDELKKPIVPSFVLNANSFLPLNISIKNMMNLENDHSDDDIWNCLSKLYLESIVLNTKNKLDTIINNDDSEFTYSALQRFKLVPLFLQAQNFVIIHDRFLSTESHINRYIIDNIMNLHCLKIIFTSNYRNYPHETQVLETHFHHNTINLKPIKT